MKRRSRRKLMEDVWKRDGVKCRYCGKQLRIPPRGPRPHNPLEATVDHVVPKAKGGRWYFPNLLTACVDCNRAKADQDAIDFRLKVEA